MEILVKPTVFPVLSAYFDDISSRYHYSEIPWVSGLQMISGGLDEAKSHILSLYRWVLIGTGFLSL